MTHDQLLTIAAKAIKEALPYVTEQQARAAADTMLRDLLAAGVVVTDDHLSSGPVT